MVTHRNEHSLRLPSTSATDRLRRLADHHLKPVTLQAPPQRLQGAPHLQREFQTSVPSHHGQLLHRFNEKVKPEKARERRVLGALLCTFAHTMPGSPASMGKKNQNKKPAESGAWAFLATQIEGQAHPGLSVFLLLLNKHPGHLDRPFCTKLPTWQPFPPAFPSYP